MFLPPTPSRFFHEVRSSRAAHALEYVCVYCKYYVNAKVLREDTQTHEGGGAHNAQKYAD